MSRSSLRSDLGLWVVGALTLIALSVFGLLWFAQTNLISRINSVSQESRLRNKKLEAKIGDLQREIRELGARRSRPSDAGRSSTEASASTSTKTGKTTYVRVTSTPSGARVRRDKRTVGRTPLVLPIGSDEEATLLITRRGYHEEEVTITGVDGNAMEVRLRKLGSAGKVPRATTDPSTGVSGNR